MTHSAELEQLLAVDAVITLHLGRSDFGQLHNPLQWAELIVMAGNENSLLFAQSQDAIKVENLIREVRQIRKSIADLGGGTHRLLNSRTKVWAMVTKPKEPDLLKAAENALAMLQDGLRSISNEPSMKTQAGAARNWQAAAVAGTCRVIWAAANWESEGKPLPTELQPNYLFGKVGDDTPTEASRLNKIYSAHLRDFAPTSEKHDAPGPFGRFLEDVFRALGILNKDGEPFPAASALRSWLSASKQNHQKN